MPRQVTAAAKEADALIQKQADKANGATPPVVQDTPPADPPQEPDYKAQYDTLKGKYNAELPQLKSQVQEQGNLITQLNAKLAEAQQQLQSQLESPAGEPAATAGSIDTDKIREDFGDDFAAPFEQLAQQNAAQAETIKRLELLVQKLSSDTQASSYDQRIEALTSLLAKQGINFNEVNTDPLFIDWLQQADAFSGYKRNDILQRSMGNGGDIQRAANIFLAYLSESRSGGVTQQSASPMQEHVRLDTPRPGQPPQAASPWNDADIAELYRAKKERRISPEEFDRLQRELFATLTPR